MLLHTSSHTMPHNPQAIFQSGQGKQTIPAHAAAQPIACTVIASPQRPLTIKVQRAAVPAAQAVPKITPRHQL